MTPAREHSRAILQCMEADRRYDAAELMMLTAGLNIEALREVMHELWLARQVERAGHDAWRRVSPAAGEAAMRDAASLRVGVKPDELFDHDSFADWFK